MNPLHRFYLFCRKKFRAFLFCEVTPLIEQGRRRPLVAEDFPPVIEALRAYRTETYYAQISDSRPLHFVWKVFWNSGPSAKKLFAYLSLRLPLSLLGPYFLHALLAQMAKLKLPNEIPSTLVHGLSPLSIAFGLGLALSATVILDGVVVQHYFLLALETYQRITSGLNMRVYRASLELSREALLSTNTGDLVNHLSSDTEGIAESSFFFSEITFGILLFIGSCAILTHLLGRAAWVAILFAMAMAPLTRLFARRFQKIDKLLWKHRDERVTLMSQILTGIRLVKSYAWEKSIIAEVETIRKQELKASLDLVQNEARSTLFSLGTTLAMVTVAFSTFVHLGGHLTVQIIFPCILVFQQIDMPLGHFPHWLKDIIHARVAAERLDKYFRLQKNSTLNDRNGLTPPLGIQLEQVDYSLGEKKVLDQISLRVLPSESIALVGEVGSGKSSLLLTILREITPNQGSLLFFDKRAQTYGPPRCLGWAPQEPFILNSTLKENILIGSPDQVPLESILFATALDQDLENLPAGLETEIGERGVNLSGGQKQRLALARIAALNPGIILLDDPLSAVDPKTESVLTNELLFGLWKDKTRIVATHRLGGLARFDRIVFMDHGRIVETGHLTELLHKSNSFRDFYAEHLRSGVHIDEQTQFGINGSTSQRQTPLQTSQLAASSTPSGSLITVEDRNVGAVPTRLYWDYFRSLGGIRNERAPWILGGLTGLSLFVVALPILQSRWLGYWADAQSRSIRHGITAISPLSAVLIYGLIGAITLGMIFFERMGWMVRAMDSSAQIHASALRSALHAPIRFFDTTPVGRLINRFSRDQQGVDDALSWNFRSTVGAVAAMLGTLIMMIAVVPALLIAIAPALIVFYRIQADYRQSAREAKRLESISRSPRFAHFKETLSGLTVLRALGLEEHFTKRMVTHLEHYTRMYWGSVLINRWFSSRVPVVSGAIALSAALSTVFLVHRSSMTAGLAGLLLTYAMSFWGQLNWSVRSFSEVESRMTSYERIRAIAAIASEPGFSPEHKPLLNWPTRGVITLNSVSARYSPELPDVLKEINLVIPAHAQVGIVGRTGSGKSSLIQALFRFIEIRSGSICIDGLDIRSVPVDHLRDAFSIIPQDPILFIGTVRTNLDRFSRFTDADIWRALNRVQMEQVIRDLGGLDAKVSENGHSFSQGQRQLLCLARALLKQCKIIVLDEATASIDVRTDAIIQTTIREEFASATVLIVAHRPNSVAHCPWILEMNQGHAVLRKRAEKSYSESRSGLADSPTLS